MFISSVRMGSVATVAGIVEVVAYANMTESVTCVENVMEPAYVSMTDGVTALGSVEVLASVSMGGVAISA